MTNFFPGLAVGQKDRSIYDTVEGALTYLDSRTEFWRQQKPMYARKREKEMKKYRPSPTRPRPMGYPCIRFLSYYREYIYYAEGREHTPLRSIPLPRFSKVYNGAKVLEHVRLCPSPREPIPENKCSSKLKAPCSSKSREALN